jgi:hypothetical protein
VKEGPEVIELKPRNKHAWIKAVDAADKVGMLYIPGNVSNQYRIVRIRALDEDCSEAQNFKVDDLVLCDMIGVVSHRIGNQAFETCLIRNFIAVVEGTA